MQQSFATRYTLSTYLSRRCGAGQVQTSSYRASGRQDHSQNGMQPQQAVGQIDQRPDPWPPEVTLRHLVSRVPTRRQGELETQGGERAVPLSLRPKTVAHQPFRDSGSHRKMEGIVGGQEAGMSAVGAHPFRGQAHGGAYLGQGIHLACMLQVALQLGRREDAKKRRDVR